MKKSGNTRIKRQTACAVNDRSSRCFHLPAVSCDAILAALLYEPENAHDDRAKSQLFAILIASSSELFLTYKIIFEALVDLI